MAPTPNAPQPIQTIQVGSAEIHLRDVQLREDITLDEIHLQGGLIRVDAPIGEASPTVATDEILARLVISEPNLNRLLTANVPPDAPLRHLQVALFSGKLRFTGQYVKLGIGLPLTLEATPRIENGIRVVLDCHQIKAGLGLPATVVDILEQQINKNLPLDLSGLPFPIWLDEARCEPGRLTVIGKVRFAWPPVAAAPPVKPFSAREIPTALPAPAAALEADTPPMLPPADPDAP